jgi:acetyltransferase-like isoleucine patch superfamily enzyme
MLSILKRTIRKKIYNHLKSLLNSEASLERYAIFNKLTMMDSTVQLLESASVDNKREKRDLIIIGKGSVIGGNLFVFPHQGKIEIGEFSYVSIGSRIWSADSIKIGSRVSISHNVNIHDTNSHSTNPILRHKHFLSIMAEGHPSNNQFDIQSKSICIEDDVWIGFNSTILKGVTIGRGSIVAACSVVTKDIPESVIVAGNPAIIVKHIQKNN